MKIFKTCDIRQIDNLTIKKERISSIDLMKRASCVFSERLFSLIPHSANIKVFAGTGNNGGDAFFIAQKLIDKHYNVIVYFCKQDNIIVSDDCLQANHLFSIRNSEKLIEIKDINVLPTIESSDFIIDGLFGSGLNRPLSGFYGNVVQYINSRQCNVISIDIPSGLMGEDNSENIQENIIHANYTLTFQFPKLAFLFPENNTFVGKLEILDIGLNSEAIQKTDTNFFFTDNSFIKEHLKNRAKFSHKGTFGHALLIGGSYGKMGAAILASRACLRSGVGLLTVHIPRCGYEIMQISVPEAMVSIDQSQECFSQVIDISAYTNIGIGVGLGKSKESVEALKEIIKKLKSPGVFDADALNILSENKDFLEYIPHNSIFTPHPKEFERLAGSSENSYERLENVMDFAVRNQIFVVLKGANTTIACPDGTCWFNSTGNPGMATAGSGDVLCGIILGLLAQQYSPFEAAVLGTYLHGLGGDKAAQKHGEASMIASDMIDELKI